MRSDSTFSGLSPGQREQLLDWLFNGGLSYAGIAKRLRKEFGVSASESSLGRFYRRAAEDRMAGDLGLAQGGVANFRMAARKLLGMATMRACMDHNENRGGDGWKAVVPLMKLMLKDQEQEMKEQRLELQRLRTANADKTAYHRISPRIF